MKGEGESRVASQRELNGQPLLGIYDVMGTSHAGNVRSACADVVRHVFGLVSAFTAMLPKLWRGGQRNR